MAGGKTIVNSTLLKIYAGATADPSAVIANCTDASLSITHDLRDITTKDSAGWRELNEGLRSFSISASALYETDASNDFQSLYDSYINTRTVIFWKMAESDSGGIVLSGCGYISSIELSSPGAEDNVTFSLTIEGDGEITSSQVV
tara:strand:+ start:109 stop:543 length:435 start_codon:yes stop_codon:yes gene_type:complete